MRVSVVYVADVRMRVLQLVVAMWVRMRLGGVDPFRVLVSVVLVVHVAVIVGERFMTMHMVVALAQ